MNSKFHEGFYSFAKYYDIAFDFKDVPKECRFFEDVFNKHLKRLPVSFIEFGAGPALHCLEMAKKLKLVTAVDLSQEMVDYGKGKAAELNVDLKYQCADMLRFSSIERYDMAALLMDSASYLLTNDQVLDHLKSVAKILNPQGLYILEMGHPRSVFKIEPSTVNKWEMQRGPVKVKIQWGDAADAFDPITQITNTSVNLEYEDEENKGVHFDQAPQRCFTANEFSALVSASNVFEIVDSCGAMDLETPFNNEKRSWRMISILQKI